MNLKKLLGILRIDFKKQKPDFRIEYCYTCEQRTRQSYHSADVRGKKIEYYVCGGCKKESI